MIKDYKLTLSNLPDLIKAILPAVNEGKSLRVDIKIWKDKRSLNQNAFQHIIYQEISKHLISGGAYNWDAEKVKFELKNQFLGWEERERVDLITGEKSNVSVLRETAKLDKGDSYHYTTQIIDWAQSIGCTIKIPVSSDCYKYTQEQNI